jgi:diaminohydroxyphosphoribosylaminopyrimidine deaminase/5-amino-6-(5-phosphoribosylamino)uracil reductase
LLQANIRKGEIDLGPLLRDLGRRDILSVLLEAGPKLNGAVLSAGLVNKMVLFYAPQVAGNAGVPFANAPHHALSKFRIRSTQQFGPDLAIELLPYTSPLHL